MTFSTEPCAPDRISHCPETRYPGSSPCGRERGHDGEHDWSGGLYPRPLSPLALAWARGFLHRMLVARERAREEARDRMLARQIASGMRVP